jgi:hypothetical protein
MRWKRIARIGAYLGVALLLTELLYLVAANGLLVSGAIQRAANTSPQDLEMGWRSAYSLWPCRVHVAGFRLRTQDPNIQFRLAIENAQVDVDLGGLLHRKFHAPHVRAEGVSYRLLTKVESVAGRELRLAAFPPLEGFSRPALRSTAPSKPASAAEVAELWRVELDDVDATLTELWFLEYRYEGSGHVHGAFALAPLQSLRVGPALLELDGGALEAGTHTLSSPFRAHAEVTISPVDLPSSPGLRVLRTLAASIQFDDAFQDLAAADLYREGLRVRSSGRLAGDIHVVDGRLMPGSSLEAWVPDADIQLGGYRLTGETQMRLSMSDDTKTPTAHGTLKGVLSVPLGQNGTVSGTLSGVTAEVVFADNDLSQGLTLRRLQAELAEARVRQASAVARTVRPGLPLIASAVLSDGPLVASASAYMTPGLTMIRLRHAAMGSADLQGAVVARANGWNGAAAGHLGSLSLGLRLQDNKLQTLPFTSNEWLTAELLRARIPAE